MERFVTLHSLDFDSNHEDRKQQKDGQGQLTQEALTNKKTGAHFGRVSQKCHGGHSMHA